MKKMTVCDELESCVLYCQQWWQSPHMAWRWN